MVGDIDQTVMAGGKSVKKRRILEVGRSEGGPPNPTGKRNFTQPAPTGGRVALKRRIEPG